MKKQKNIWVSAIAAAALLVLIFDAKTALLGARSGLEMCLNSVIPSLFPFICISVILNSAITGMRVPALRLPCRLCGIPEGAESLLLLGLIGGYPVGAQSINDAYKKGAIRRSDGQRLLGFCSNAGPAFIFGISGGLFVNRVAPWALWIVHIFSALLVGIILPGKATEPVKLHNRTVISLPSAVTVGVKTMSTVCGWVILFRMLLAFFNRWFLWILPDAVRCLFAGILELTNGIHRLYDLQGQGIRFVFAACYLSFGGMCVAMQTLSVTEDVGAGLYFPGKIMQCLLSFLAAYFTQFLIFPLSECFHLPTGIIILLSVGFVALSGIKINVAFRRKMVYNNAE